MIRLQVWVPKPVGCSPGQRFRLEQWAPHLEKDHGIVLEFFPFESPALTDVLYRDGHFLQKARHVLGDALRRRTSLQAARNYHGAVIYREAAMLGPAIYERLLKRSGVPIVYDFDDAIWLPPAGTRNGFFSRLKFEGKTKTICRLSSTVVVGNVYLAAFASQYNARVAIVPTTIELEKYPLQPPLPQDDPFVIAWSGSVTTLPYLEPVRSAIEKFAQSRRVKVRILCNAPLARPFAHAENEFVQWQEAGEAEAIGRAHVGIMPLPNDDFTRGKCGLKALQYMAVGLPVVLSPIEVNREIVRHDETGLWASTEGEWISALERLASDRALRSRLGQAGRKIVENHYTAATGARLFAEAVRAGLSFAA